MTLSRPVTDFRRLFDTLPCPPESPPDAPIIAAVAPEENSPFRVGRDARNRALVLINAPPDPEVPRSPAVQLEHLQVEHSRNCRVRHPDGTLSVGSFTLLLCTSSDALLRERFLSIAGGLVPQLGNSPTPAAINAAVEGLVELFRKLEMPPKRTLQGLWAEVALIADSQRPDVLVRAWHVLPDDRFDFSLGIARLEVKSAAGGARHHHFTLAQLSPPAGTIALVASVFVERAGGGESLGDLIEQLGRKLAPAPDLLLRVETVIASTLGSTIRTALAERFDREMARGSLAYYRVEDVPTLREPIPPLVSDVRFRSDLGGAPTVRIHELAHTMNLDLFVALPPAAASDPR